MDHSKHNLEKIARLLITLDCKRNCDYCCNNYNQIMSNLIVINNLEFIKDYQQFLITGGEPMLNPKLTKNIILRLRKMNSDSKIYLYTARFHNSLPEIIDELDGLQYTLHKFSTFKDISDFYRLQNMLHTWSDKSFRLYINNELKYPIKISPLLWKRIEIKAWETEEELLRKQPRGLPPNEDLFLLRE